MGAIFEISTEGPGLYEFTDQVLAFVDQASLSGANVSGANVSGGLLTLFVQHTSCSLLIQENADPDVRADLDEFFQRLVPPADAPSMRWLRHLAEGPDDMPAHLKAALLPTSLSIPLLEGRIALGAWQGIYLFEHRNEPHKRRVIGQISP